MTEFMQRVLDTQARAEAKQARAEAKQAQEKAEQLEIQQKFMQAVEAKIAAIRSRSTSPERRTTPTAVPFVSEEAGVPSRPANSVGIRMSSVQTSGGLSSS